MTTPRPGLQTEGDAFNEGVRSGLAGAQGQLVAALDALVTAWESWDDGPLPDPTYPNETAFVQAAEAVVDIWRPLAETAARQELGR